MSRESSSETYTLPYVKETVGGKPLYSTEFSGALGWPRWVGCGAGRRAKREVMYVNM